MKTRPEYDFKIIGKNLRQLRISKNLTVEDVREYMQLGTVQSVYKWERGDSLPQADSLMALLDLYDVHNFDILVKEESLVLSSSILFIIFIRLYSPTAVSA